MPTVFTTDDRRQLEELANALAEAFTQTRNGGEVSVATFSELDRAYSHDVLGYLLRRLADGRERQPNVYCYHREKQ